MKTSIAIAALLVLFAALPGKAHAQQRIEIFGGYSYLHTTVIAQQEYLICPGTNCPILDSISGAGANLNGWEATGAYRFSRILNAAADFQGVYGSAAVTSNVILNNSNVSNEELHLYSYLFGPQISLPGRISPFAQVLVGEAHESPSFSYPAPTAPTSPAAANSFAAAFGGGIDFKLTPRLWLRPIQFRELLTRFRSDSQYQPTISAGIVLHL